MSHDLQDCTVILLYMIYNSYFDPVNQIVMMHVDGCQSGEYAKKHLTLKHQSKSGKRRNFTLI